MPRAVLVHNAFTTTGPSATSVLLDPGQDVSIYEPDGTTPIAQAVYDVPVGGVPLVAPYSADNLGMLILYTAVAQSAVVTVNGIPYPSGFYPSPSTIEAGATGYSVVVDPVIGTTTTGNHGISGPIPHVDVRTQGARVGGNTATNRAAIQAAIDKVIAAGGGRVYIPERYNISGAPLVIATYQTSVEFVGNGRIRSGITQDTPGVDVLVVGSNYDVGVFGSTTYATIRGMLLGGGRYALRLNNAIACTFHDLLLIGSQVGLYMEGQCERDFFSVIDIANMTSYGILTGQANTGTDLTRNFPEFQKCYWEHIRVSNCLGPAAINLNAGIWPPVGNPGSQQQASGHSTMRHIVLEDTKHHGLYIERCDDLTIDHFGQEETGGLAATATYSSVYEGVGCGVVRLLNTNLNGADNVAGAGRKYFLHCVHQTDGVLYMESCQVGGVADASGMNIQLDGLGGTIISTNLGSAALLGFGTPTVRENSIVINPRTSSGVPTNAWHDLSPAVITRHSLVAHSTMAPSTGIDLGPARFGTATLCDFTNGGVALVNLRGPGHVSEKVSDTLNMVGITLPVTPNTWFLGWSGTSYVLQNNYAAAHEYSIRVTDLS